MRVSCFLFFAILLINPIYAQDYLMPEVLTIENGLSSRNVSSIMVDHQGYLWAGTKGGLNRYNGYGFKQFFTPSSDNGSAGTQNILSVQCDALGNIWILSEAGVNRIEQKTGDITQYPISEFDTVYDRDARLRISILLPMEQHDTE
jgi:ligand-binding sensor domain-containing protein